MISGVRAGRRPGDKVALITEEAPSIGGATARRFAGEGPPATPPVRSRPATSLIKQIQEGG